MSKEGEEKKKPHIQLYTGDYIKDTRQLSLAAKGAWSDLILFMWAQEKEGVIEGTLIEFARLIGGTPNETFKVLSELSQKNICDGAPTRKGAFKIICRRLVKEAGISKVRREAVQTRYKTGTNDPTKSIQKSDNDNDSDIEGIDNSKKELFEKVSKEVFSDQQFVEKLSMVHRGKDLKQAFGECFIHHSSSESPPEHLWQWRQKLNSWLSIKPKEKKEKSLANPYKVQ